MQLEPYARQCATSAQQSSVQPGPINQRSDAPTLFFLLSISCICFSIALTSNSMDAMLTAVAQAGQAWACKAYVR
jgi:hypothetical protein